ncbi:lipoprotein NlpI [Anaerohalosphaera lusitana]|uniref:Lipoprotein NlpI n=1 Tax=Anaerohalosphaera lusitana TaxID=1936003 RepID=A0A1U9NHU4_9BACT|nr:tetratricopeptide repeat protein [Anaerohalosphaera lusitana]AQT67314.1 lipoprotein NlpI [Anaerohalosphaera lusitana]
MANASKLTGLILTAVFLVAGCDMFGGAQKDKEEPVVISSEQRKTELLEKIEKDYDNAELHYELGKIYQADGLWQKAETQFSRAIGFDPVHRKAEAALVKTLTLAGEEDRAAPLAKNYLSQAQYSPEASLRLGRAFQQEGLNDYAITAYKQALDLAPNSAGLNKQIGYYYLAQGDKVRAEEYLRRSFQLNPNQPEVAGELGRMGVIVQVPKEKKTSGSQLDKLIDKLFGGGDEEQGQQTEQ